MASDDHQMTDDRAYFESLYRAHYPAVLRFAARRTDPQSARDITAETFLAAWRRLDTVPRTKELAWLYTVARNMLVHELRGNARRSRLTDRLRAQPMPQPNDPADTVVDRLHAQRLLDALPAKDREVLQLVEWEHLDISSAAQVVGCTAATFRVRLHRARRRLLAAAEHSTDDAAETRVRHLIAEEATS
jgi:RNA polymerase sigma-70 factor (ECF subfamily)